ncbi:MAG: hypothetical protein IT374_05695 [Polyangiaceae bacterium]|nr:hypothetical protein [Polyangiaceae bacterium]
MISSTRGNLVLVSQSVESSSVAAASTWITSAILALPSLRAHTDTRTP